MSSAWRWILLSEAAMNLLRKLFQRAFLLPLLLPAPGHADVVVIVNPRCEATTLTRREVINIFMGRFRFLPSGQAAKPYDLPAEDTEKARFYLALTGKQLSAIDAYWARLIFTGGATPPDETPNAEIMLEKISSNIHAIGYIERSQVDKRVRILFEPER
jgi:ABC-type phosphate transport system substrate-binding protein